MFSNIPTAVEVQIFANICTGSSGKGGSTGDAGTGTNGSRLQATQSCIDYGSMDLDELIMERTNFATGAITRTRAILDRLTNFMVSLIY